MSRTVLDASAVLAALQSEPGGEALDALRGDVAISALNIAEVTSKLVSLGAPPETARDLVEGMQLTVYPFDEEHAYQVAALRPPTRAAGLSIGDRACIALGIQLGAPVLTADRAWRGLGLPVEVILIR